MHTHTCLNALHVQTCTIVQALAQPLAHSPNLTHNLPVLATFGLWRRLVTVLAVVVVLAFVVCVVVGRCVLHPEHIRNLIHILVCHFLLDKHQVLDEACDMSQSCLHWAA